MNTTVKIKVDIPKFNIIGDIELDVDFELVGYDPGNVCGPPDRCYPPEGEILLNKLILLTVNGEEAESTPALLEFIQEEYCEQIDEKCFEVGIDQDDYYDPSEWYS